MKKKFILAIGLAAGLTVYPQKHTAELFNVPGAQFDSLLIERIPDND